VAQGATYLRIATSAVLAAIIAFSIHVFYGQNLAAKFVSTAFKARHWITAHQPYPPFIFYSAFATAIVRMLGFGVIYSLIQDRLPGRSRAVKGLVYGLLIMFCTDDFLRLPAMNLLVGNPIDVVLVQSAEGWAIYPLIGLTIALVVRPKDHLRRIRCV